MFERYTEKARRVIFVARLEASQFQSPSIETEHLLLGLLREYKPLANRLPRNVALEESIRKHSEAKGTVHIRTSTSEDMPISEEGKRVFADASEEAERMGHTYIGIERYAQANRETVEARQSIS